MESTQENGMFYTDIVSVGKFVGIGDFCLHMRAERKRGIHARERGIIANYYEGVFFFSV